MNEKTPAPVGAAVALDLAEIEARFADATADEVIYELWPALVAEVLRLTAEAATQREWFEAADAAADRRLDQSIAWMERAEAAEAEVRRLTESRATVAANLSASLMLADAEVVTLRAKLTAVEAVHVRCGEGVCNAGPKPEICHECGVAWPCPTFAALAVTTGEGE
ncbi:MAG TPA: hypothetical protein PK478_00715 [Nitrospira sp.]|nr:hypothetical protein [Nitrospira sp.]